MLIKIYLLMNLLNKNEVVFYLSKKNKIYSQSFIMQIKLNIYGFEYKK